MRFSHEEIDQTKIRVDQTEAESDSVYPMFL